MSRGAVLGAVLALLAARVGAAEPVDVTNPAGLPRHDASVELAKPFHESSLKRFENVFFISLPFTALYASLLTTAGGYAIRGRRFALTTPVIVLDLSLAAAASALIASRDAKANAGAGPAVLPALPPAPAASSTTTGGAEPAAAQPAAAQPSSTLLR